MIEYVSYMHTFYSVYRYDVGRRRDETMYAYKEKSDDKEHYSGAGQGYEETPSNASWICSATSQISQDHSLGHRMHLHGK